MSMDDGIALASITHPRCSRLEYVWLRMRNWLWMVRHGSRSRQLSAAEIKRLMGGRSSFRMVETYTIID